MEWHIITSSKGGTGKTLLSSLLLSHFLEKKCNPPSNKKGSGNTLLVDLNATNADSYAMLTYEKKVNENEYPFRLEPKYRNDTGEFFIIIPKFMGFEAGGQILSSKTYSFIKNNNQNQACYYAALRPLNPYLLFNPVLFVEFISKIKEHCPSIQEKLGIDDFNQVIIDTGYHPCNLFSSDEGHEMYKNNPFEDDDVNIWFIWTYRQLYRLIQKEKDAVYFELTANAIETHLKNSCGKQIDEENTTPFRHVFNPITLTSSQQDEYSLKGTMRGFIDAIAQNRNYTINELKEIEDMEIYFSVMNPENKMEEIDIVPNGRNIHYHCRQLPTV